MVWTYNSLLALWDYFRYSFHWIVQSWKPFLYFSINCIHQSCIPLAIPGCPCSIRLLTLLCPEWQWLHNLLLFVLMYGRFSWGASLIKNHNICNVWLLILSSLLFLLLMLNQIQLLMLICLIWLRMMILFILYVVADIFVQWIILHFWLV